MKKYILSILISQLVVFSSFLNISAIEYPLSGNNTDMKSLYKIRGSVRYDVQVNFTLQNYDWNTTYYFLNPRLENHTPYQEVDMLYNSLSLADSYDPEYKDKYGNIYDQFNTTLPMYSNVELNQHYEVKLNEIEYGSISDAEIGEYNLSEKAIELYLSPETFYNTLDPDLISVSNSIVKLDDNPVEKARKIYDWVVEYLDYDIFDTFTSGDELGASWAYDNQIGDCSEFSSLMVTLLRIQGIPARKVVGILVTLDSEFQPKKGDSWEFTWDNSEGMSSATDDFFSHAWVEYYVPNIGWIACDPTWGDDEDSYFNYQDFLRFGFNYGSRFPIPGTDNIISELGSPIFSPYWSCYFSYGVSIKVIGTNYPLQLDSTVIMLIVTIGFFSIVLTYTFLKHRRKKSKFKVSETEDYIIIE